MPQMKLRLKDIVIDPLKEIDLPGMPEEQVLALLTKAYEFVSPELQVRVTRQHAILLWPDPDPRSLRKARKWCDDALGYAKGQMYQKAIELFSKAITYMPADSELRRNLAMAYLEAGDLSKGEKHAVEAIRLDPQDAWSWVLLGNIYAKHKQDVDSAEELYQRAYDINPEDPYLLTNIGAIYARRGPPEEARTWFQRALEADDSYPNAHYGLALSYMQSGQPQVARLTLETMFETASRKDPRSEPLWAEARDLYLQVQRAVADMNAEETWDWIEKQKGSVEELTGHRVETLEDAALDAVAAKTETAWSRGRDYHRIRYRPADSVIVPHLVAHELEHVVLEFEALSHGVHRSFATTPATREQAIRSVGDHVYKLQLMGLPESTIMDLIRQMVDGLANQLFNCPLDMVIEYRLFRKSPPPYAPVSSRR